MFQLKLTRTVMEASCCSVSVFSLTSSSTKESGFSTTPWYIFRQISQTNASSNNLHMSLVSDSPWLTGGRHGFYEIFFRVFDSGFYMWFAGLMSMNFQHASRGSADNILHDIECSVLIFCPYQTAWSVPFGRKGVLHSVKVEFNRDELFRFQQTNTYNRFN